MREDRGAAGGVGAGEDGGPLDRGTLGEDLSVGLLDDDVVLVQARIVGVVRIAGHAELALRLDRSYEPSISMNELIISVP